jgi:hypothetical protein
VLPRLFFGRFERTLRLLGVYVLTSLVFGKLAKVESLFQGNSPKFQFTLKKGVFKVFLQYQDLP